MGKLIFIESSIGGGKSTLGKGLELYLINKGYKALYISEFYVPELLSYYYDNMKTQSYNFQIIMIRERIKILENSIKNLVNEQYNYIIIDRGIIGDLCFAEMLYKDNLISEREYNIYKILATTIDINIEDISSIEIYVLYLDVTTDTSMNRIKLRSRIEEKKIDINYLVNLINTHKNILQHIMDTNNNLQLSNICKSILLDFNTKFNFKIIYLEYNQNLSNYINNGIINYHGINIICNNTNLFI